MSAHSEPGSSELDPGLVSLGPLFLQQSHSCPQGSGQTAALRTR